MEFKNAFYLNVQTLTAKGLISRLLCPAHSFTVWPYPSSDWNQNTEILCKENKITPKF